MQTSTSPRSGSGALGKASQLLSPRQELRVYEGVRRGDETAFRTIASSCQPLLRRLAALSTDDVDVTRTMIDDTWHGVLRSLAMFTWHTSLTAWIAAGVVGRGRASHRRDGPHTLQAWPGAAGPVSTEPPVPLRGPRDWSDLPFGARWGRALEDLRRVHVVMPLHTREVLHLHDVEHWPVEPACDVLGLTTARHQQLLEEGHRRLHDALAACVGDTDRDPASVEVRVPRIAAALRLLHGPRTHDEPLDPRTLRTFRLWAAEQANLRHRLLARARLLLHR